ncbi:transposase [Streptomyces umbrinus]|uniref:Transposase n=1 Tax=Streptomyces umbrinus TaxID=67370 RepID=A0ABU0SPU0_9ACTN|nr:transposase [Streptomyces umbrinus]
MSKAGVTRVDEVLVTVGIDTYVDVHVAAALDQFGRKLDVISVATAAHGRRALLGWVRTFAIPYRFGAEGTGAYGAGLTRCLRRQRMDVVEVIRPSRQTRRPAGGKNDAIDAEAAACTVQAGAVMGQAKSQDGLVEMIRSLPGMGPEIGAEFIAATGGDMDAFDCADRMAGFAGLALRPRDSGRVSGNLRRPKRCRCDLLWLKYLPAMVSLTTCPASKAYYERKRSERKGHNQALLARARRTLNVLWAMIREGACTHSSPLIAGAA